MAKELVRETIEDEEFLRLEWYAQIVYGRTASKMMLWTHILGHLDSDSSYEDLCTISWCLYVRIMEITGLPVSELGGFELPKKPRHVAWIKSLNQSLNEVLPDTLSSSEYCDACSKIRSIIRMWQVRRSKLVKEIDEIANALALQNKNKEKRRYIPKSEWRETTLAIIGKALTVPKQQEMELGRVESYRPMRDYTGVSDNAPIQGRIPNEKQGTLGYIDWEGQNRNQLNGDTYPKKNKWWRRGKISRRPV